MAAIIKCFIASFGMSLAQKADGTAKRRMTMAVIRLLPFLHTGICFYEDFIKLLLICFFTRKNRPEVGGQEAERD